MRKAIFSCGTANDFSVLEVNSFVPEVNFG
jgi:hypothetical protein